MSKIFIKTQREPLFVTKETATLISKDNEDDKVPPNQKIEIKHLDGVTQVLKADIRTIDISYSDKDYFEKKRETAPAETYVPKEVVMTPEEIARADVARRKVRENLVKIGIIREK